MTTFTPEQIEAAARAEHEYRRQHAMTSLVEWEELPQLLRDQRIGSMRAALATLTLPADPSEQDDGFENLYGSKGTWNFGDEMEALDQQRLHIPELIPNPPELISARERLEAAAIAFGQQKYAPDDTIRSLAEAAREFARAYAGKEEG